MQVNIAYPEHDVLRTIAANVSLVVSAIVHSGVEWPSCMSAPDHWNHWCQVALQLQTCNPYTTWSSMIKCGL